MDKRVLNPNISPQNPLRKRDKDNNGGRNQQDHPSGENEVFGKAEDNKKTREEDAEERPADNGDATAVVIAPQRGVYVLRFGTVMGKTIKERRYKKDERDTIQDAQNLWTHQFTKFFQRKGIEELNRGNNGGKGTHTEDDGAGERSSDDDLPTAGGPLGFAGDAIAIQTVCELR